MLKFSIITPSFNQGRFIGEAIKSIWSQGGNFSIQHIVIDGKSTDKSVAILKKYERLLDRETFSLSCKSIDFIWKSEKDRGQSEALNKGSRLATGRILAYLNADDTYRENAFSTVAVFFEKHPNIDLVYSDYWTIDQDSKRLLKHQSRSFNRDWLLNRGNMFGQPTVFFRRRVYEQVGDFNPRYSYALDYDYWCRASSQFRFQYLANTTLANFRVHEASKSVAFKKHFWRELRHASRKHGGKFFNPMLATHYLQLGERFVKDHFPKPLVKFLQSSYHRLRKRLLQT